MPEVVLYKQDGTQTGTLNLSEHVFGEADHQQAIWTTVVAELAAMRQGTQKAKGRSEVRGGGRKPWRQKGTGRARQGSIRAAQWRGGGVIFAPTPRSYAVKVNKKVVKLAKRCALSTKVRENKAYFLDELVLDSVKTKGLVAVFKALNIADNKLILIVDELNDNLRYASNNIANLVVATTEHASVYQIMNAKTLVLTKAAVEKYEEALK